MISAAKIAQDVMICERDAVDDSRANSHAAAPQKQVTNAAQSAVDPVVSVPITITANTSAVITRIRKFDRTMFRSPPQLGCIAATDHRSCQIAVRGSQTT